jgi:formylglycine-generating enzyme required for sulfatase activity
MVFANNVVYTDGGEALRFPNGSRGVTVAGNVLLGETSGVEGGFVRGRGLEDFEDLAWDGGKRNAAPRKGSPADGAGDERFRVAVDLAGRPREGRAAAGASEPAPGDRVFAGSKAGDEREIAGIRFSWCPPGTFRMGSPAGEPERRPGEDPVEVTLTKGFWIGKHEVTQGQWEEVAGELPGELTAGGGDEFPLYAVNFAEAEEFCRKLTEMAGESGDLPEGWEVRLPTEAQWEYACRAGTTTATSFGDSLSSAQANFQGKPYNGARDGPSLKRAARVGSYPANPWGIHDMHGNVFEWCRDWYHSRLPGGADPDLHDARASATRSEHGGISRVRRGGCWADEGWPCRSAFRLRFEPERRHDHIGFRVVVVGP